VKDEIMKELAASRPAHLSGDGTVDEATRSSELSRAFSQPRAAARRRRRLMIVPAVVAGVAAATALALVVGLDSGDTRPSPATTVPLRPNSMFLAAAAAMERQPTGKYWFTDQIQGQSYIVKAGYAITGAHSETFEWTSVKKGGGNLFYGRDLPARPLTKEDKAAWRKAGKPSSFRVWSNDHYGTYTTQAGPWQADRPQARPGGKFFVPGAGQMTTAQLQNMTTDPARLAKTFLTPSKRSGSSRDSRMSAWLSDPAHVILNAGEAFGDAPLPPRVRAGLMRALVAQPGIRNLGTVTDPLGRRGIAIGAAWSDQEPGFDKKGKVTMKQSPFGAREELIFDAKTGEYLGSRQVLTRPGGLYRSRKPGFVINYWLERESGWTDKKPVPPRKLPFTKS
jgi:hypothetical protein